MGNRNKITQPVYQQIAIDLAAKIAARKYPVGCRLAGRSVLASQYGVSPETIRRAAYILKDMGIVEITKGSGIEVTSIDHAVRFVEQRGQVETAEALRREIFEWVKKQKTEAEDMFTKISQLVDMADRFRDADALAHYALKITESMDNIDRTSSDLMFWHNTGATIIAIKRDDELILSPGPYADFAAGDTLYFVGDESSYMRVLQLFGVRRNEFSGEDRFSENKSGVWDGDR